MLFKSKRFWISAVFIVCAVVYFALMHHQAKQPQKVITVYEVGKLVSHETLQLPADATVAGETRYDTDTEVNTTEATPQSDLSEDTSHRVNAFTDTRDESYDTSNQRAAADALADESKIDAAAEAEAVYAAQQVVELYTEISQTLQERRDLFNLIFELAEFGDGEPYALRQQLQKEAHELRKTIFKLCSEYISYTMDDSPFQPGGEFYDLMKQNRIGISVRKVRLEEVRRLP